jgi:hypothetical protein
MDWLLISCIGSALAACGLGLTLYINWQAERFFQRIDAELEAERAASLTEYHRSDR